MLQHLHVKNLALIREIDVDFTPGMNVLTGETGAGKSIIIDAIGLGLGGRMERGLLKDGASGLVELNFSVTAKKTVAALTALDIHPEGDLVILSRKITEGKSVCRINGEVRTAQDLRAAGELLLDIHGQSDHQKLLREEMQLALLDRFGGKDVEACKAKTKAAYGAYKDCLAKIENDAQDPAARAREISFLSFEIDEITNAQLKEQEDETLEAERKKLAGAQHILEDAAKVLSLSGEEGAGGSISTALQLLQGLTKTDAEIAPLAETLAQGEDILQDFHRSLSSYLDGLDTDGGRLQEVEERLDLINRLKMKYGQSVALIQAALAEKEERLSELQSFEETQERLAEDLKKAEADLQEACTALHRAREKAAARFAKGVRGELSELNFARNDFSVQFTESTPSANGADRICFYLATNPGEKALPLVQVASGGELSRVMLGIETLFADLHETETLIFDEVDAGISGVTAQKVAERLHLLAKREQILCITHLPQIAAVADTHFGITKALSEDAAVTQIARLSEEASVQELARLISGARITEKSLASARELKAFQTDKKRSKA